MTQVRTISPIMAVDDNPNIPISVFVLTFNNDRTIGLTMESLGFADEIVVIDSGSTDKTLGLVEKYTDRVIPKPWQGFKEQYAFAQNECRNDWVMVIDSDEEVSPRLAEEIRLALDENEAKPAAEQVDGFIMNRRTFFVDRWIFHGGWVPDREVRLFRRSSAEWAGSVRGKVEIKTGKIAFLRDFIYHYTYADISDQIQTLNHYSTVAAQELATADASFSCWELVTKPVARFFREYILRGGFRDGVPGLIIATNNMNYSFNKYAKLWERQRLDRLDLTEARAKKPKH